ncbi:MAG: hypothetical protein N3F10_04440 [Candidatus Bathyarchaeota archaeon]|nr:hypothetical protein [Candidatus Bathyarchaeota archaeon]MCX8177530.1 hypothetical protein [Candidatus Bathyarchaeota archaeon]
MKHTLRVYRDRRAITPVLSNLLLMVVAVAAMSIAAAATYMITMNLRETMGERLIIEDVWFKNEAGNPVICIYIRNTGKSTIQISDVYINSARVNLSPRALELDDGEHGWLNVTYPWEPGRVYKIETVTRRGTKVGDYYKSP